MSGPRKSGQHVFPTPGFYRTAKSRAFQRGFLFNKEKPNSLCRGDVVSFGRVPIDDVPERSDVIGAAILVV
jgi:hypothetical protein